MANDLQHLYQGMSDHDLLIVAVTKLDGFGDRLREHEVADIAKFASIDDRLSKLDDESDRKIAKLDSETDVRLSKLEQFRWLLTGVAIASGGVAGAVAQQLAR